ncbi:MAG: MurR/RpiR family transcriptional regulator [Deltaproteobacteria bacterium]|nr:MurR/RpiR family transcriptional regulator [Deltaproteobacteria bacterium]
MAGEKNLFDRIMDLKSLTKSEAKIVNFINHAHSRIAFEKVTSIAQKADVGKASVVRFISRLGFDSFKDFQKCVQEEINDRLEKPIERFLLHEKSGNYRDGDSDILEQSIAQIIKNLQGAHDRITPKHFKKAAQQLSQTSGSLYVGGNLASFGLAYFFWLYARYLRERVHLINNLGSVLPYQLLDVKAKDTLFVITHHLYSKQTQLIVEFFAKQGAKIIMLTDTEINPFSHLADIALVAPCESSSLFDSSAALLAVMEALIAKMERELKPSIYKRFKAAEDLFGHLDVFAPSHSMKKRQT